MPSQLSCLLYQLGEVHHCDAQKSVHGRTGQILKQSRGLMSIGRNSEVQAVTCLISLTPPLWSACGQINGNLCTKWVHMWCNLRWQWTGPGHIVIWWSCSRNQCLFSPQLDCFVEQRCNFRHRWEAACLHWSRKILSYSMPTLDTCWESFFEDYRHILASVAVPIAGKKYILIH